MEIKLKVTTRWHLKIGYRDILSAFKIVTNFGRFYINLHSSGKSWCFQKTELN